MPQQKNKNIVQQKQKMQNVVQQKNKSGYHKTTIKNKIQSINIIVS